MLKSIKFRELVLGELMPKALEEYEQIHESLPNEKDIITGDKNKIRANLRKSSLLVFVPSLHKTREELSALIKLATTNLIMKNTVSKNNKDGATILLADDIELLINTHNTLNDLLFNLLLHIYPDEVQELENSMTNDDNMDDNNIDDEDTIPTSDQLLDILIELGLKGRKRK